MPAEANTPMSRVAALVRPGRVLDVGSDETVVDLLRARQDITVLGIQRDRVVHERARSALADLQEDVRARLELRLGMSVDWPFDAASFDAVILREALDHRLELRPVVEQAKRVVRDDGIVIVMSRYGTNRHFEHADAFWLTQLLDACDGLLTIQTAELTSDDAVICTAAPGSGNLPPSLLEVAEERARRLELALDHARSYEPEAKRWKRNYERQRARADQLRAEMQRLKQHPALRAWRLARRLTGKRSAKE